MLVDFLAPDRTPVGDHPMNWNRTGKCSMAAIGRLPACPTPSSQTSAEDINIGIMWVCFRRLKLGLLGLTRLESQNR